MTQLLLLASLLAVIFLLWRLVSPLVLRTPVDNIPGPLSGSLFSGRFEGGPTHERALESDHIMNLSRKHGAAVRPR